MFKNMILLSLLKICTQKKSFLENSSYLSLRRKNKLMFNLRISHIMILEETSKYILFHYLYSLILEILYVGWYFANTRISVWFVFFYKNYNFIKQKKKNSQLLHILNETLKSLIHITF